MLERDDRVVQCQPYDSMLDRRHAPKVGRHGTLVMIIYRFPNDPKFPGIQSVVVKWDDQPGYAERGIPHEAIEALGVVDVLAELGRVAE